MANTNFGSYSQQSNNYGPNQQSYAATGYGNLGYPSPQSFQQYMSDMSALEQLQGRPVTSVEEARALPIKLDGTVFYFPDMSSHKIYTKQFNPDGSASFKIYVEDNSDSTRLKYVTQQELMDAMTNIKNMVQNYLFGLNLNNNQNISNNNISQPQPQNIPPAAETKNIAIESQQQSTFNI